MQTRTAIPPPKYEPTKENETVDGSLPLFDSDGYPHRLVELGSIQVVTKYSFVFVVWDRKTLEMQNNPGSDSLKIGNTPMAEAERERRRLVGRCPAGRPSRTGRSALPPIPQG
ncbi:MAG: hypothetical protein EOP82_10300 [Variovorax sp.]|nr:MAG: hypothetical protein EOP82_10300 [Variovorax sp.]